MSDPSAPTAEPDEAQPLDLEPQRARGRTAFIVAAGLVVLVVLVVAVVAVLATRGQSTSYTADDQQKFMSACMSGGGEPVRGTCGCIYDQMSTKVPYDRFVAVDADLRAQRDSNQPLKFPAEVEAIRVDCVARSTPATK